ncbi:MAG: 2-oxoglutarate dehydrogenase complex dihydrolipoyllysine-residue succinyltransferase [Planctomycetaceae bacterium]|nr:2-oxoglutarate dehydrogenase complex dihydrolipoyllysine-residue succinyltransferase [Planctomycetaceae bacterium]
MPMELRVPEMGESITEVQIGAWLKREGDTAGKDEPLVEIESEKATVEVSAPEAGQLTQILKKQGEAARVGDVIGYFQTAVQVSSSGSPSAAEVARAPAPSSGTTPAAAEKREPAETKAAPSSPHPTPAPAPAAASGAAKVMPAAARALAEQGLQADEVAATGPGGRLLKEDVRRHAAAEAPPRQEPPAVAPQPAALAPTTAHPAPAVAARSPAKPAAPGLSAPGGMAGIAVNPEWPREQEVVPMSPMRRAIAERLVQAQQTAALVTTFNEIDMSALAALRKGYRDAFQEKYDIKLGMMSFFVKAAVDALKQFPQLNAEVRGNEIVYRNYFDIGVAVGGGKGLVVPVVRNAERLSFAEIEIAIEELARRARENKLKVDELTGGTFTITNGGIYGSLLSTPIVNPPQSGVLGLHGIQERPIAHQGQVVVRPMMYVALTYDHRIVDGREAVTFLRRIKEVIEEPARMLLEV